jgi:hypothetical protein
MRENGIKKKPGARIACYGCPRPAFLFLLLVLLQRHNLYCVAQRVQHFEKSVNLRRRFHAFKPRNRGLFYRGEENGWDNKKPDRITDRTT